MNIEELKKALMKLNIPSDAYQLNGGFPNEAFCINYNGEYWETYYSERGLRTSMNKFSQESDACEYFLQWIKTIFKK